MLAVTLVGGCGDAGQTAPATSQAAVPARPGATGAPPAAGAVPESGEECPATGNARRFAKTRFALHAGLALGAFYRYIYKPLRSGGFNAGADKRKRTFVKAAVAGAFALHELKVAKRFATANPTLCKGVQAVSDSFSELTGKLRNGTATEADLEAGKDAFDALKQNAARSGYDFKEREITVPSTR
ncbi:hypothetical protein Aros01_01073 [Streptosporangium roseum]|uniref:Uncharacterized protein n=2 Tax=Streptosporangium roseum TaxID=2001 RepID=D2B5V2_STRRD|nr:hypothetical protein Sros_8771 [Streptosporangium roseum DSM 43021]